MKIIILCLSCLFTFNSYALGFGFGTYMPTASRYQDGPDGSREAFQLNPFISLTHYEELFTDHYLTPELGIAFHSGTEDEYSKRTIFILWHAAWHFHNDFNLRYGLATFWTKISGDGEEVELPNGNSTATFYAPSKTSTAYTSSVDVGLEYIIDNQWGIRADFFVVQPLESERRALSYMLSAVFAP